MINNIIIAEWLEFDLNNLISFKLLASHLLVSTDVQLLIFEFCY